MAQTVETDVPDYPFDVAVFRPGRVMPHPRRPSHTIQQPRRLWEGYLAEADLQKVLVTELQCLAGLFDGS